jgi:hypothetical protein
MEGSNGFDYQPIVWTRAANTADRATADTVARRLWRKQLQQREHGTPVDADGHDLHCAGNHQSRSERNIDLVYYECQHVCCQ